MICEISTDGLADYIPDKSSFLTLRYRLKLAKFSARASPIKVTERFKKWNHEYIA